MASKKKAKRKKAPARVTVDVTKRGVAVCGKTIIWEAALKKGGRSFPVGTILARTKTEAMKKARTFVRKQV